MLTAMSEKMHFDLVTTGFHPPLFCEVMLHYAFLLTGSFGGCGNYGVRPGCLLGNQSLELTDSAHASHWSDTRVLWGMDCCRFHLSLCVLPQFTGLNDGIWYKARPVRGIIDHQHRWLSMCVSLQLVLTCLLHLEPCSLCFLPAMGYIPQNNPKSYLRALS